MHAGMPYLHCFGEENFKIGKDNRSADIELLDEHSLKNELNRIKPLTELQEKLYNKEWCAMNFWTESACKEQYILTELLLQLISKREHGQ